MIEGLSNVISTHTRAKNGFASDQDIAIAITNKFSAKTICARGPSPV